MNQSDNYENENNKVQQENEDQLKQAAEHYAELDFECEYSDNIPKILKELNISLAFTSYQAGRLMTVRSDGNTLNVNYKSFPRPMGLSASEDGLTLGVFTQVLHFQREDGLLDMIKKPLERIENDISAPRTRPKGSEPDKSHDHGISATNEQLPELNEEEQEILKDYQENLFQPVDERVDAC